ncbi:MAG TPA: putative ABC exporter domain-containing protein [Gemmatimonadales bacterium]
MNGTAGALTFLIVRSNWNRLYRQVRRIKSPRYALALLFGIAYFWFFIFRSGGRANPTIPPATAGTTLGSVAVFGFWITAVLWWLTGGTTSALAFQPAEMHMLFSAPISRRTLLVYRIARGQVQMLFGALIWTFLIRRWGVVIAPPLRFLSAWGFFSVLSMHRLGTALVQTQPVHGRRLIGLWVGRLAAVGAALAVVGGVLPALYHFADGGPNSGFKGIGLALSTPPASIALAPLRWLTAPLYAPTAGAWAQAYVAVLGLMALHLVWILNMQVRFEEAAATATAEMAKRVAAFRERRATGGALRSAPKSVRQWLPLKPVGPPAVALVWKNTLAFFRVGVARPVLIVVGLLAVASIATHVLKDPKWGGALAASFLALSVMTVAMGPRTVRNDLRQDLQQLPIVKGWPLSGGWVVAAEIASPTILLTVFEVGLLLLAWWSTPSTAREIIGNANIALILAVTPVALLMFNGMAVAVQNAAALLFPSWVRLGIEAGGIEMIGQNLLVLVGSFLVQAVLLLLPAAIGLPVYWLTSGGAHLTALFAAGGAGAVVLGAELVLFVLLLGKSFEKLDPTALT